MTLDSHRARATLEVGGTSYTYFRLAALHARYPEAARLPFSLKVLLENLLRCEDGHAVTSEHSHAVASWRPEAEPRTELAFTPSRVLLQDFTGVPAIVDLAAMRDAMRLMGGDPTRINPQRPVDLVIDHSVQVDAFGSRDALAENAVLEFARNQERYRFLKWGQSALHGLRVLPPDTGIVHQVNLEHLAQVITSEPAVAGAAPLVFPDTLVGADSHTTMVNGLGVLGWGVGGIEAEAAMLGLPVSMLVPQVVGVRLTGALTEGSTATDLVLTITELLRKHGVVGKFVEFFGPALATLSLADRATAANMAPEYGATVGMFPIDAETLRYLALSGRTPNHLALVEAYAKAQGLWTDPSTPEPQYTHVVAFDLGRVEPSLAGPSRPEERVGLREVKRSFREAREAHRVRASSRPSRPRPAVAVAEAEAAVVDGSVVLAAITSCTNTSNPSVMIAAGLVAQRACERGLTAKPWVKASLAPGSKVVTDYLAAAGLLEALESVGFFLVGYGCTTCIGNSGPLPSAVSAAIAQGDLVVASVLSGNRNFEGRVHAEVRANYLASPPLVVAYALAGRIDLDLVAEPLAHDPHGTPVFLRDLWPSSHEVAAAVAAVVTPASFERVYVEAYVGDPSWRQLSGAGGVHYDWQEDSTYVVRPPYFDGMAPTPDAFAPIANARVLALFGDGITTDHISPAGEIAHDGPAARYLLERGIAPRDFNSYGARRGNHELMVRGTFANVRLRNRLVPGAEGGVTRHLPSGDTLSIFDASTRYLAEGVALVVLAGKNYGSGSSRDWAAKGPKFLGVRAVIAESFERIHRSNLVGMGILPLEFLPGESASSLGLSGEERLDVVELVDLLEGGLTGAREATVRATRDDGGAFEFRARVRIDTPQELAYYRHGGILPYVLRRLLASASVPA